MKRVKELAKQQKDKSLYVNIQPLTLEYLHMIAALASRPTDDGPSSIFERPYP
jgi:hypothetical protein